MISRKHLFWRNELARRKYWVARFQQLAVLAAETTDDEWWAAHALNEYQAYQSDRDYYQTRLEGRSSLEQRLIQEHDLRTRLREFDQWPDTDGRREYELHWYRFAATFMATALDPLPWRVEERKVDAAYYYIEVTEFLEELDAAVARIDTLSDEGLFQEVHRLAGRGVMP